MNGQNPTCERKVQIVHLVQMDIAVVDPNSPGRWIFGTYIWDGNRLAKRQYAQYRHKGKPAACTQ